MKKLLISITLVISAFCFTLQNVKAEEVYRKCIYYAVNGKEIEDWDHIPTDKIHKITCELDTSSKDLYNVCSYKYGLITAKDGCDQKTGICSTGFNNFVQADKVDGIKYKDYVRENKRCPDYIEVIAAEQADTVSVYFRKDVDVIKNEYAGGKGCYGFSTGQGCDNVWNLYLGAKNIPSLKELAKISNDVNHSDAEHGEKPDYVEEDENKENNNKYKPTLVCGFIGKGTFSYIKLAWNILKYSAPALVVILGMLDFAKVVLSGEDKDMKVAGQKFLKRIIAAVVLILLPILIQFIFSIANFSEDCLQYFK